MTTVHESDFPFNELRMPTGDYYDNSTQMMHAGFEKSQMWSVVEADGDDGAEYLSYGPCITTSICSDTSPLQSTTTATPTTSNV